MWSHAVNGDVFSPTSDNGNTRDSLLTVGIRGNVIYTCKLLLSSSLHKHCTQCSFKAWPFHCSMHNDSRLSLTNTVGTFRRVQPLPERERERDRTLRNYTALQTQSCLVPNYMWSFYKTYKKSKIVRRYCIPTAPTRDAGCKFEGRLIPCFFSVDTSCSRHSD